MEEIDFTKNIPSVFGNWKHFTITLAEKRMKKFHARGKWQLPPVYISKFHEEQRGVRCKSVVNCHDLHSDLKMETGKLGCE